MTSRGLLGEGVTAAYGLRPLASIQTYIYKTSYSFIYRISFISTRLLPYLYSDSSHILGVIFHHRGIQIEKQKKKILLLYMCIYIYTYIKKNKRKKKKRKKE